MCIPDKMFNKYFLSKLVIFCPRQEPWSIAQLTKNWYINMSQINMPFLEELSFRNYVYLKKYGTIKTSQLPSAECKYYNNYNKYNNFSYFACYQRNV